MGRENTSSRRICIEEVSSSSSTVIDPLSEISCDVAVEENVPTAEREMRERRMERERRTRELSFEMGSLFAAQISAFANGEREKWRERRRTRELSFKMGSLFAAQISSFANGEREERRTRERTFVQIF